MPGFLQRLKREVKRLCILALLVAAVAVAAKYYGFNRLDEEIRARFETRLRASYPGLLVTVKSARRVEGQGVELRGISIQAGGDRKSPPLVRIDEILAECDTHLPDFITQEPTIRRLHVRRLKLRAERQPDGSWGMSRLLPLPVLGNGPMPAATITDSSIEIVDPGQSPPCTLVLRNIELTIRPQIPPSTAPSQPAAAPLLQIQGTLGGDHMEKIEIAGVLDPRGGRWDLRGAVEGLEFSPRLRSALPAEISQLLAPVASVRGRTYFGFETQRGPVDPVTKRPPPIQFTINGKIAEGRIDDARLPDPLTDVEATIYADNLGIRINDLSARCGATHLEMHGEVSGYSATSPCKLRLHAKRLDLDRLPLKSLPASVCEVWDKYSPRGTIDLDANLHFDGRAWQPDLQIQCHDLSLLYDRFAYRVTDGTGTIQLKQNVLTVRLRTLAGSQVINMRAEIRQPGPDFTGWVDMQSHGALPIDEKLVAALDSKGQRLVRMFQPRGGVSFHARFHRDSGEATVHRKVNLNLHECSIEYDKFRYPIDKIGGTLQLTDDDWVFHKLEGRNGSGYISADGFWLDEARDGNNLSLQFTATDVPLEDELRRALSPALQRLWSNLRPRGNIDHLKIQVKYNADQRDLKLNVEAQKWPPGQNVEGRSISIEPACFRYKFDNLTGTLRYDNGAVKFTSVQAVHGQLAVETDGSCELLPDGSSRVQLTRLTASRVHLDNELLAALPETLASALVRLNPSGPLGITGGLGFRIPAQSDAPPSIDWDLTFDLENGRLDAAIPIEHVHGGLRLWGKADNGGFLARGEINVDSAIVRDVQLTQLRGPIWIDPQRLIVGTWAENDVNDRVRRRLTANAFGGAAALDAQMELGNDGHFQLQSTLENADLALVMSELAPRQKGLSGKLNALVNLTGKLQGKHTWSGDGQIRLFDADIYELPVMISMLSLLSVRDSNRTAFTKSNIDFRIRGDDLEFDRIDFNGDAISLKGHGRMMASREIDLKFHPQLGRDEAVVPFFRPLNAEAGKQFLLVEVSGTLDRPRVHKQAFPRIDAQLQQIFPELASEDTGPAPAPSILRMPREALERSGLYPWKR